MAEVVRYSLSRTRSTIFSLTANFDNVKHNNHIRFDKSHKMAVSFNLNNAGFPPLSFPIFCRFCFSVFCVTAICYCMQFFV